MTSELLTSKSSSRHSEAIFSRQCKNRKIDQSFDLLIMDVPCGDKICNILSTQPYLHAGRKKKKVFSKVCGISEVDEDQS